jgi:hypothetical protein
MNSTETYAITQTFEIPEKLLRDIIITACEGGIGYWSQLETYNGPAIDEGAGLPLKIREDLDGQYGEWMTLDLEQVALGFQRLVAERPDHPCTRRMVQAIVNYDNGNYDYDADDADAIVQYGVLGSWTYG